MEKSKIKKRNPFHIRVVLVSELEIDQNHVKSVEVIKICINMRFFLFLSRL